MTATLDIVLDRVEALHEKQIVTDKKVDEIGTALNSIALQQLQLDTIGETLQELWKKSDANCKDIVNVQLFQAACPKEQIQKDHAKMWAALCLVATVTVGMIIALTKVIR